MKKVNSHIRQGVQVRSYVANTKKGKICVRQKYKAGIINPGDTVTSVNKDILNPADVRRAMLP